MSDLAPLEYRFGQLYIEDVPLDRIAREYGTPVFAYSRRALVTAFEEYAGAARGRDVLICYAVKANGNLAILQLLAQLGAGFDIVSGGELARVLKAGGAAERVIFSGVGKTVAELKEALQRGIGCINVESTSELMRLNGVARDLGVVAPVSLRINPDVDALTHPYISTGLKESKFGIPYDSALAAYDLARTLSHLEIIGIDCHIGSQILDEAPLLDALTRLTELVDALEARGIVLRHLDVGGGLGIAYGDETAVAASQYVRRVLALLDRWQAARAAPPLRLVFEPGRSIVGNAGVLVTRVEVLKPGPDRNFAIVDAAMNDLMRPALYDAWHDVLPFQQGDANAEIWDIVGPICESADWLARARRLTLAEGDLLALRSAGAYAMSMASNYNSRPRAAEVLVSGAGIDLIRSRETIEALYGSERLVGRA